MNREGDHFDLFTHNGTEIPIYLNSKFIFHTFAIDSKHLAFRYYKKKTETHSTNQFILEYFRLKQK